MIILLTHWSYVFLALTHRYVPGVGNMRHAAHVQHEDREQNEAAAIIQAAYRGHAVRQSLDWTPSKPEAQVQYIL